MTALALGVACPAQGHRFIRRGTRTVDCPLPTVDSTLYTSHIFHRSSEGDYRRRVMRRSTGSMMVQGSCEEVSTNLKRISTA